MARDVAEQRAQLEGKRGPGGVQTPTSTSPSVPPHVHRLRHAESLRASRECSNLHVIGLQCFACTCARGSQVRGAFRNCCTQHILRKPENAGARTLSCLWTLGEHTEGGEGSGGDSGLGFRQMTVPVSDPTNVE